ncbi:hypothetical protein BCR34DRAFT_596243 [Clohesyomyces aquaticus]|uniref:Uncharacterized protein n=1 Tax=Clohesyomyces aquaticus TaxID=1231657 RepID=A0A1Y2A7J7_9PLEO|nr:hypothetical protein BCR34DRAFT_596243 [Clohesyomyces aquaticus]
MDIPLSKPEDPTRPFLCSLPAEIRLDIYNYALTLTAIPSSFGYTGPYTGRRVKILHTHALILVSKQVSVEYRQAFYERTRFFLRIDPSNAFLGAPGLANPNPPTNTTTNQNKNKNKTKSKNKNKFSTPNLFLGLESLHNPDDSSPPNFWSAPPSLVSNLRHCTLYVEIGEIAACPQSIHSLSALVRSEQDTSNARQVILQMKAHRSLSSLQANDSVFDQTLLSAVLQLLDNMQQLRSLQLVWETTRPGGGYADRATTNWKWETLGRPCVERAKGLEKLRDFRVGVGNQMGDVVEVWKKWGKVGWEQDVDFLVTVAYSVI